MSSNCNAQQTKAKEAVFLKSKPIDHTLEKIQGYDFNNGINYDALFESYKSTGFQATNFHKAIKMINQMIYTKDCIIFLGFTSNMVSCGLREVIRFLVEHKLVNILVTTAGGIEEDLMKCIAPHVLGSFHLDGKELRKKGHNRIGNLIVPNENYCKFEDWIVPILDDLFAEQKSLNKIWSPSKMINRFGKEINDKNSICYWAYKNDIPIYCPALTDGSIGDMIYFSNTRNEGFIVDIVSDIISLNNKAIFAKKTGMIILGGGLIKHHICNANLMRNGADYSVYINTGQEFDGSDSGARPDEAISWGKIKVGSDPVKVYGEATLIFPMIVSQTFAKYYQERKKNKII